jgi:hypothetical protein
MSTSVCRGSGEALPPEGGVPFPDRNAAFTRQRPGMSTSMCRGSGEALPPEGGVPFAGGNSAFTRQPPEAWRRVLFWRDICR